MRTRAIVGGVVSSAAVLVIGWHLGADQVVATTTLPSATAAPAAGSGSSSGSSSGATTAPSGSSSPSASSTPAAGSSGGASTGASSGKASISGTFDGSTAQTPYGPVQVEIVVASGKITDVKALQLTNEGGRSVEISNYAAPVLRTEALSAQSANIQSVSGATYTSEGYVTSLQSAIDKAGL